MFQTQPDLFRDYLPMKMFSSGVNGLVAFGVYCSANGINPFVDSDETHAARLVIQRIWGG